MSDDLLRRVEALLYEEAAALDEQRWEDWLEVFLPDCEYWMPAWDAEHELTQDPTQEISLIYYSDRSGLEDRVWRIKSGMSSASTPLPRTSHIVSNVRLLGEDGDGHIVKATWQANTFRNEQVVSFFGTYEYRLAEVDGALRVRKKKIVLMNDVIPSVVDVYSI